MPELARSSGNMPEVSQKSTKHYARRSACLTGKQLACERDAEQMKLVIAARDYLVIENRREPVDS